MSPAVQRYEVGQIFAECREKGLPAHVACFCVMRWFEAHQLPLPPCIFDWLEEVPHDHWHPAKVH